MRFLPDLWTRPASCGELAARLFLCIFLALPLTAQTAPERVGPLPGGSYLLNTGWQLQPAGQQLRLEPFPVRALVSPDGRNLVVLHSGAAQPSVQVFSTSTWQMTSRVPIDGAGHGLAFAPGGSLLYVAGGASGKIYEFALDPEEGRLDPKRAFGTVLLGKEAVSPAEYVGDVQFSPDGRLLYATALFQNRILVINPQSGWVIETFQAPQRPYRILPHPDGKSLYVTSWAEGSLHHLDASDGSQIYLERLGAQPMDMVWSDRRVALEEGEPAPAWSARLFVATANTNQVQVLGVDENKDVQRLEPIRVQLWPRQPLGMTPTALALSPSQDRLYVVCSDANVIAVVDISSLKPRVLCFVPTGWYPTDVAALGERRVAVLNGKGDGTRPNADINAGLLHGSASIIDLADDQSLFQYTKASLRASPYNDRRMIGYPIPEGNPIPPGPDVPEEMRSPIEHVLYIVKDGLSYDEVFGSIGAGEGYPTWTRFGEKVTPNHHQLARDFVLFDNFYASGETEADGRMWATSAIASAFVQRLGPSVAARRLHRDSFDNYSLAAAPPTGFLWTQARLAGLSVRNYGFMTVNLPVAAPGAVQVGRVLEPSLDGITDLRFRGPDTSYSDVDRARAFLADLARMEQEGDMPRLMVMHLGNDRAAQRRLGLDSEAYVAENDHALGMIVEACTRSRYWPRMAIFVAESNAAGRDHVDPARSVALAISPYTRLGKLDSTLYNSASVLRTIELILGLAPMTQFDAAAIPMWLAFTAKPDPRPWSGLQPKVPLPERE